MASLIDPFGFLSPDIIRIKLIMQELDLTELSGIIKFRIGF